ncbi:heme uptake protein IsdC [Paenibacillus sp. 2TAB26]|uniref:heme uptake protein IsdC n=1 Tax=Paenibacillus sp. 2TAB26 TaxID=3233005 RepID=UPI003F96930C
MSGVKEEKRIIRKFGVLAFFIMITLLVVPFAPEAHAAELADGTYSIDYVVKKAEDESVSMANDYWEKPAKLIVTKGALQVQLQINHSSWVTEYKVPSDGGYIDTAIVSSNEADNTRIVKFGIADLTTPLESKIHVTVEDIDYDHSYTIRLVFDSSSLKQISKAEAPVKEEKKPATTTKEPKKETDAKTGTTAPQTTNKVTEKPKVEVDKPSSETVDSKKEDSKKEIQVEASPAPTVSPIAAEAEGQSLPKETLTPSTQESSSSEDTLAVDSAETAVHEEPKADVQLIGADMDTPAPGEAAQQLSDAASSKRVLSPLVISLIIIVVGVAFILLRKTKFAKK